MPSKTLRTALIAATLIAGGAAQAQPALAEIKVSYQPALYWALPFFVATEKNWWAEVGLKPVFSTFPAGVPQIAAVASKSWDVGGTGSVPAVLGLVLEAFGPGAVLVREAPAQVAGGNLRQLVLDVAIDVPLVRLVSGKVAEDELCTTIGI